MPSQKRVRKAVATFGLASLLSSHLFAGALTGAFALFNTAEPAEAVTTVTRFFGH